MQKQDCLKQITEAIADSDLDRAVGLWMDSYAYISPLEFVQCSAEGGLKWDELVETLQAQRFMYDQAIAHIERTYYYPNEKS